MIIGAFNLYRLRNYHLPNAPYRSVCLAYHPRHSLTWYWSIEIGPRDRGAGAYKAHTRHGQWHDVYWLPFGLALTVGRQDWHKRKAQT